MTNKKMVLTEAQLEEMLPVAMILVEKQRREQWERETEIPYKFSKGFERKMEYLIAHNKPKTYRVYLTRAAQIILVIGIALSGLTLGVEALRIRAFEIVRELYTEFTQINFSLEKLVPTEEMEFELYEPTWLPEGFEKKEVIKGIVSYEAVFSDGEHSFIYFQWYETGGGAAVIDTEDIVVEQFSLDRMNVEYVLRGEEQHLIGYKDACVFHLISSDLKKEDLITIMSSMEK